MNNISYKTLIVKSILILLLSLILGTVLLYIVYLLPTSSMDKSMRSSAVLINEEGLYPDSVSLGFAVEDNWTDAIMLGIASFNSSEAPIIAAMSAEREMCNSGIPTESVVNHYLLGQSSTWSETYERYWHGYLVSLKPLLLATDYQGIRIINLILQSALLLSILVLLYKENYRYLILPFLLCCSSLRLFSMANCISYSANYYLVLISSLSIILINKKPSNNCSLYIFLLSGIATAYLDILKFPIITYGIPAVLFISLNCRNTIKVQIRFLLLSGLIWLAGYGFMWAGKWLVGSLITGNNYFISALGRIGEVSGSNAAKLSLTTVLHSNLHDYLYSPVVGISVAYSIYLFIQIIHYRSKTIKSNSASLLSEYSALSFLALVVLPFLYIVAMKQHVGIHSFFENKVLSITLFSVLSILSCIKHNLLQTIKK